MPIQAIRGMNDLMPGESELWQWVEDEARRVFDRYNYREIRTPIVEALELFTRSLGATTSLVEKEMYSFEDRRGKKITLRPEGTASVIRAYIQNHYNQHEPLARLFYMGPMYRYERPQKGRYRQFYQIGAEAIGSEDPLIDAEVIHMTDSYFRLLGLDNLELEINSLGCMVCRPDYVTKLTAYLERHLKELCDDCIRRIKQNPLRALDCKQEQCLKVAAHAPSIQESLCDACESHFDSVLEGIGRFGSSYTINPNIVRGLDYYQRTSFEFTSKELGAQNAVCGGGRYDGLVQLLGGPHVPGVGFAIGVERLVALLDKRKWEKKAIRGLVFIAAMGKEAIARGITFAEVLRDKDISVEANYEEKGLKALLRRADKLSARFAIILGSNELAKNTLLLRDMENKTQEELSLDQPDILVARVKSSDMEDLS